MTVNVNTEYSKPDKPLNILVIGGRCSSDNHIIELLTKLVAADLKYTYTYSLYHALSHKSDTSFDIILVDISDGSGIDTRDLSILSDTYTHHPMIAVDNEHNDRSATNARNHGAQDYIVHTAASKDTIYNILLATYQRSKLSRHQNEVSHYDDLTGLANETTLINTLENALEHTDFEQVSIAVLSVSIYNKQQLEAAENTLFSRLLPAISRRLEHNLRDTDMVAQRSDSRFSILLRHLNADIDSAVVAEKLIELLQAPYDFDGHSIILSINIGIALPSVRHCQACDLISDADNALSVAQELGPDHFSLYTLRPRPAKSLNLRSRLQQAIAQDQFRLVYQPQVDIKNGSVIAVEALLRWQLEPDLMLTPAQFMHHVEQSRHCTKVAHWVIDKACQQISEWQKTDHNALPISINLSHKQFIDPSLLNTLENALLKHGSNAKQLRLEVNEVALRQDTQRSKNTLEQLKSLGIELAIDDFGADTCSLHTLSCFNVDQVKIDGSLVHSFLEAPTSMAMVNSLISTCHHLGIGIAAEAVETSDQLDYLTQQECDSYQGFLFSKPLSAEALPSFIISA